MHIISDMTSVTMLNRVGKEMALVVRFSSVRRDPGSADTARGPKAFSVKCFTEEGNWDWVILNKSLYIL